MGFNVGDNVIFICNKPRYNTDNRLRGKIGTVKSIDNSANEEAGNQSLQVNWPINGMHGWWTMANEVRLAKPNELS